MRAARPGSTRLAASRLAAPRGRLRTAAWIVLATMLLVGVVATSLWTLPALRVAHVEYRTDPSRLAALTEAAPVPQGQPLVQVDTDAVRDDALSTSLFSAVRVSRSWPSTIVVEATPRTPVVAVTGPGVSGVKLVDRTGVPFETVSAAPSGVPVASADRPGDPSALRALAAVVTGLPADLVTSMKGLTMDGSGMIAMHLGTVVVNWGDASDNRLKAAVVRDLVDRAGVARIDVSAPLAPVTSADRERSTWAPGSAASTGPADEPSATGTVDRTPSDTPSRGTSNSSETRTDGTTTGP